MKNATVALCGFVRLPQGSRVRASVPAEVQEPVPGVLPLEKGEPVCEQSHAPSTPASSLRKCFITSVFSQHDWCPEGIDAVDLLLVGMAGEDAGTCAHLCMEKYPCRLADTEADPGPQLIHDATMNPHRLCLDSLPCGTQLCQAPFLITSRE